MLKVGDKLLCKKDNDYINYYTVTKINGDIVYFNNDVVELDKIRNKFNNKIFTKVFMHEALAYINENQFDKILSDIKSITSSDVKILIGGILDAQKKWNYFNTIQRKLTYLVKFKILGKEVGIGKWWNQKDIINIANRNGYQCKFIQQNSILHTAHYRFDVLITRSLPENTNLDFSTTI